MVIDDAQTNPVCQLRRHGGCSFVKYLGKSTGVYWRGQIRPLSFPWRSPLAGTDREPRARHGVLNVLQQHRELFGGHSVAAFGRRRLAFEWACASRKPTVRSAGYELMEDHGHHVALAATRSRAAGPDSPSQEGGSLRRLEHDRVPIETAS